MSPIEFYSFELSPPCRTVWMALETLGLEYEWKDTHLAKGATRTPEYLKLNPLHTIPLIVDDGLAIAESRAILLHLVRKYRKDECSLYPTDLDLRSRVDQRLFFDLGSVWAVTTRIWFPVLRQNKLYDRTLLDPLEDALKLAEDYVRETGFIAGTPDMSLADISFLANYTSLRACALFKAAEYPGLEAWVVRCSALVKNYEKCNGSGAERLGQMFQESVNNLNC